MDREQDLASIILNEGGKKRRPVARAVLLLALAAVAVAGWFAWSRRAEARDQPAPFVTEPVRRGSIGLTITATGNLEPTNEVTVGSELSGTALEVYVDTNDHVSKG